MPASVTVNALEATTKHQVHWRLSVDWCSHALPGADKSVGLPARPRKRVEWRRRGMRSSERIPVLRISSD